MSKHEIIIKLIALIENKTNIKVETGEETPKYLNLDSLALFELHMEIEHEFDISISEDLLNTKTVKDMVDVIFILVAKKEAKKAIPKSSYFKGDILTLEKGSYNMKGNIYYDEKQNKWIHDVEIEKNCDVWLEPGSGLPIVVEPEEV